MNSSDLISSFMTTKIEGAMRATSIGERRDDRHRRIAE
jgi:hypothetical protein